MKLTEKDKAYLKGIHMTEEDFGQIEAAMGCSTYEVMTYKAGSDYGGKPVEEKRITRLGAVRLLGREGWLSGLARSAFHITAMREVGDGRRLVYFNSEAVFRG